MRVGTPSDWPALAELYRVSALELGRLAYSDEQVRIWAGFADDEAAFRGQLRWGKTFIAELAGRIVAFAHLHPLDHVSLLYTHPEHARCGHARAVYHCLEEEARRLNGRKLETEASRLARPFFESEGFEVMEVEYPVRGGVTFERFRMRKWLFERRAAEAMSSSSSS